MRVIHIIFCSLLSIGSAQIPAGADSDALKNALGALTPAQIQAILGAVGSNADVHVGGTNEEAKLPVTDPIGVPGASPISIQPVVPQQPVAQPAVASQPAVLANPQTPVQPAAPVPSLPVVPAEAAPLTPTDAELAADTNLLTPVESPERLEDDEIPETIGAAAPSENIDPAEDTPLQPAAPIITITTPQPTTTTTNATTTSTPAVAEPAAVEPVAPADVPEAAAPELDLAALFAKMSPEDQQALLAQAAQPAAVSTEVLSGQVNAAQDALASPVESVPIAPVDPVAPVVSVAPVATNPESAITTSFGSRADSTELATDVVTEAAAPVETSSEQTASSEATSDTISVLETGGIDTSATIDSAATISEPEIDTGRVNFKQFHSTIFTTNDTGVTQTDVVPPEETSTTELGTASDGDLWEFGQGAEYEDDDDYEENDYEEDDDEYYADEDYDEYDEDDEEYEEYDEDEYADYTTDKPDVFGDTYILDDAANDGGFNFASDAQDVNPDALGSIELNYRLNEELREIDEMEEEFEDTLGEDKANWNFAFFLIVFVIVVTGVYYVVNLIRTKCCPKNSQSYSLLPGQDADIKTSVGSESKEEWNNDDW